MFCNNKLLDKLLYSSNVAVLCESCEKRFMRSHSPLCRPFVPFALLPQISCFFRKFSIYCLSPAAEYCLLQFLFRNFIKWKYYFTKYLYKFEQETVDTRLVKKIPLSLRGCFFLGPFLALRSSYPSSIPFDSN